MTSNTQLTLLMELYEKGLLCHCQRTTIENYKTEDGYEDNEIVVHEDNCPGKLKLAELMGYDGKIQS